MAAAGRPAAGPGRARVDLKALVDARRLTLVAGFSAVRVAPHRRASPRRRRDGKTGSAIGPIDRIVVATGQRPDLTLTRELRLDLDPWLESAKALGPLIDPNVHSCGSVPPHGHRELAHPEPGFYTVGDQELRPRADLPAADGLRAGPLGRGGDRRRHRAADDVHLVLPETGVARPTARRGRQPPSGGCGGPAPAQADACCVADAEAKAAKDARCGRRRLQKGRRTSRLLLRSAGVQFSELSLVDNPATPKPSPRVVISTLGSHARSSRGGIVLLPARMLAKPIAAGTPVAGLDCGRLVCRPARSWSGRAEGRVRPTRGATRPAASRPTDSPPTTSQRPAGVGGNRLARAPQAGSRTIPRRGSA